MADQKQDESFKVIDRRLFTQDGELRQEAVDLQRREQESATAIKPPASPGGPKLITDQKVGQASPSPQPAPEAPKPSRGFQLLIDFLARNAALLLGGYADPRTGQAILDLDGARELIDMLDALREVTQGNLAPEDDSLLVEVLGSLKMSFLEMSKRATQAMQEKAKSRP